jgi:hypothetical protein
MAGYTYDTYVEALQTMVVSKAPDVPFTTILPSCIDYAEQRIYRELDLISTVTTDISTTTSGSVRDVTLPNTFVVVNTLAIFTPAGSDATTGTRKPLLPVSRDALDALWPSSSDTGEPNVFSMTTQWELALGPSPDGAYKIEATGTQRPTPLSNTNSTTFLSERLPDLFLAASMVFMSGYMRNFGAQASDPQMGMSWETQYGLLKGSADTEEARKHFRASAWTSQPVPAQATPPRG